MRQIVLIAHNVRSTHNVGSLLRTAEGLGIQKVYLTGYAPYPLETSDKRLPHIAQKLHKQIQKTALGAESMVPWIHCDTIEPVLDDLQQQGFTITALEQADTAIALPDFVVPEKVALVVGREVEGIEPEILDAVDTIVEIPMFGKKESFNVVQAAAMALYYFRFA